MRFLSILALLSTSYVAASENLRASPKETADLADLTAELADIAAQEKRKEEQKTDQDDLRLAISTKEREVEELKAKLNLNSVYSADDTSLGACTDDGDWVDKTELSCKFYTDNKDWCADALEYKNGEGKTAKDACCVCGGGESGYGKGVYWIKSRKTGEYLGIYKITSPKVRMTDKLWSPYIKIEVVPLEDNEYALMSHRYGNKFLSVGESGEVKLYHLIGDYERFKIMEVSGGVQIYNVKWGKFLDVYNGVKTSTNSLGQYTTFNLIPTNYDE